MSLTQEKYISVIHSFTKITMVRHKTKFQSLLSPLGNNLLIVKVAKTIHKNSKNGKYAKKQRVNKVEVLLLLGIHLPEPRKQMPGFKSSPTRFKPPTATEAACSPSAESIGHPSGTSKMFTR